MTAFRKTVFGKFFVLMALLATAMVPAAYAADDLPKVLAKLDAASSKFKSAQADIVWDNVQTQPLPDTDSQVGTVLFDRKAGQLRMALHIKTDNGRPVPKDMVYADGLFKLYEPKIKQMQVFKAGANRADYDTFLTLGFGGSGKDLQRTWDAKFAGTEAVDGQQTWKLELVAKEESVRKTFSKVVLWVDEERGIALKQQSFDTSGNYRVVTYKNIQLNGAVPGNAFELKPPAGTNIVNH
jgi:outer membrane lipoprotein-sorting protein